MSAHATAADLINTVHTDAEAAEKLKLTHNLWDLDVLVEVIRIYNVDLSLNAWTTLMQIFRVYFCDRMINTRPLLRSMANYCGNLVLQGELDVADVLMRYFICDPVYFYKWEDVIIELFDKIEADYCDVAREKRINVDKAELIFDFARRNMISAEVINWFYEHKIAITKVDYDLKPGMVLIKRMISVPLVNFGQ